MTLEELQVVIEAQTSQFRSEVNKVQNEAKRMTSNVTKEVNRLNGVFKALAKTVVALGIGKFMVDSTKMAMKVEGAIQQINRTMQESSNAFLKWADTSANAFNLSKSDAIGFGAIYSNLLSTFIKDSSSLSGYTQRMLQSSAIIASGTGRTIEDVNERIRSGLLGNTEAIILSVA